MRILNGIVGNTLIGLKRYETHLNPMHLTIEELELCGNKEAHCYDCKNKRFITSKIKEVIKIGSRPVRNYRFSSDCHGGKESFGTEGFIIATPYQKVLTSNCKEYSLRYLEGSQPLPNELLTIKRKPYNEIVEPCKSSFLISFDYNIRDVYTLVIEGGYHFVANGLLVSGL